MRVVMSVVVALLVGSGDAGAEKRIAPEALRAAVQRGLDLLVKTSPTFIQKGGCNSCHNQSLPAAAQAFARRRGIAVGEPLAQIAPELSEATLERYAEYSVVGGGGVNALIYELFASHLAGVPADGRTRAQIRYLKSQQQPQGYWRGGSGALTNNAPQALSRPAAARPPLTFDDFTPTAYVIRALTAYGAPAETADTAGRVGRAKQWLLASPARGLQERAFKLLGLVWASADRRDIDKAAADLQAMPHASGGFAQLPTLPPDAYATGIALFALHEAGMPATHRVYQAGLAFLLTTQARDGTWHVRSRSLEFQPYFESGYPYGRDQWISAAGAAYATLALAAAVEPSRPAAP